MFDVSASKVSLQAYVNEENSCGKRLVMAHKTIDGRRIRYIDYRHTTRFEKLLRTFCLGPALFKSVIHEGITHGVLSTLSIDEKERLIRKVVRYNTEHSSIRSLFFKVTGVAFFNWLLESHIQRAKGAYEVLTTDAALRESLKLSQESRALLLLAAPDAEICRILHMAAESGSAKVVQQVLITGFSDPNELDEQGFTPLHLASKNGCLSVVQMLTENGHVKLNQKSPQGYTPLHFAVIHGHLAVARHLLEYEETDVNAQDSEGWTPLHHAAELRNKDMVELLLMHPKINVNAESSELLTPLHEASRNAHTQIVDILCGHKNVSPNRHDDDGWTALHYAANQNSGATVESLIRNGAFVNAQNDDGWTPLHVAASEGHIAAVRALLRSNKINSTLTDYSNLHTPLSMAIDRMNEAKDRAVQEKFRTICTLLNEFDRQVSLRQVVPVLKQRQDDNRDCSPS